MDPMLTPADEAATTTSAAPPWPSPDGPAAWKVVAVFVPVFVAAVVGAYAGMTHLVNDPWSRFQWEDRGSVVQEGLIRNYADAITYDRGVHRAYRYAEAYETIVVNGTLREDCTVKNDRDPVLVCDRGPAPKRR